ncbi:MAG: hypothetical protein AAGA56_17755, partial [Myxococcota bacterium]
MTVSPMHLGSLLLLLTGGSLAACSNDPASPLPAVVDRADGDGSTAGGEGGAGEPVCVDGTSDTEGNPCIQQVEGRLVREDGRPVTELI